MNSNRKALDGRTWGNFKYNADSDTLLWKEYYRIEEEHDTIQGALYWIASMKSNVRDFGVQDSIDLANAFSDLLDCKIMADAYRTSFQNRGEFWRIIRSTNYSVCQICSKRHYCLTNLPEKMP